LTLRQGLVLTLLGLAIGIPAALGATQLMRTFLIGMSPLDGVTYMVISCILMGTSLLACYLPARRAARIDPLATLRSD
jgi:putative ABC transport system permease protein